MGRQGYQGGEQNFEGEKVGGHMGLLRENRLRFSDHC